MNDIWQSPFNQFNSLKILMWRKHIEACVKGEYLVPPMVDLDTSALCQLRCPHCNAYKVVNNKSSLLPESHFIKLAEFLGDWRIDNQPERVLSCCISGGGEPLLNTATYAVVEKFIEKQIEVGLISNGLALTKEEHQDILAKNCSWIGFSIDAATPETYNKLKGVEGDLFNLVCENISKLAKKARESSKINRICYKFLLTPENYKEIYAAAKLAKELGVHDFHLRPVGYEGIETLKDKTLYYSPEMLQEIDNQMKEAVKLSNGDFMAYGVRHKFSPDFKPRKNFSKCWCIPMLPTFAACGKVYYCFDIRGRKDTVMCSHYPNVEEIAKFWNSQKHKDMVNNFDVNSCTRCTFSQYNEAAEEVFIKDKMYRNFL